MKDLSIGVGLICAVAVLVLPGTALGQKKITPHSSEGRAVSEAGGLLRRGGRDREADKIQSLLNAGKLYVKNTNEGETSILNNVTIPAGSFEQFERASPRGPQQITNALGDLARTLVHEATHTSQSFTEYYRGEARKFFLNEKARNFLGLALEHDFAASTNAISALRDVADALVKDANKLAEAGATRSELLLANQQATGALRALSTAIGQLTDPAEGNYYGYGDSPSLREDYTTLQVRVDKLAGQTQAVVDRLAPVDLETIIEQLHAGALDAAQSKEDYDAVLKKLMEALGPGPDVPGLDLTDSTDSPPLPGPTTYYYSDGSEIPLGLASLYAQSGAVLKTTPYPVSDRAQPAFPGWIGAMQTNATIAGPPQAMSPPASPPGPTAPPPTAPPPMTPPPMSPPPISPPPMAPPMSPFPNLAGMWALSGDPTLPCRIDQAGDMLTLTNEFNMSTSARFLSPTSIITTAGVQPGQGTQPGQWEINLRADLVNNNNRLNYANNSFWTRQ